MHRDERWPSLLGKGYLIHVEAEATTTDAVPSAHGREPRDASTSLRPSTLRLRRRSSRERIPTARNGPCDCTGQVRSASWGPTATRFRFNHPESARVDLTITVGGLDQSPKPGWSARSNRAPTAIPTSTSKTSNVTNTGELGKIDVGQVSNFRTVQNGIYAIDMPDFYLAHTETTTPSTASLIHANGACPPGQIDIPEGVNTLRFGGVDVDYTPAGGTAAQQDGSE